MAFATALRVSGRMMNPATPVSASGSFPDREPCADRLVASPQVSRARRDNGRRRGASLCRSSPRG